MSEKDLICKIFEKCYFISTNSECDVFFDYAPHCKQYSIHYYLHGYTDELDYTYITRRNKTECYLDINIENLIYTLGELNELWQLIEESNLKKS